MVKGLSEWCTCCIFALPVRKTSGEPIPEDK